MKPIRYHDKPIASIDSLAQALHTSPDQILEISKNPNQYYIPNKPQIKPNGKTRQTYRVKEPLKSLQRKILDYIIGKVEFPDFLQGSIRDAENPRDYLKDANLHAGKTIVINEDVKEFFDSISSDLVLNMWKNLFHFPKEIADILTKLTTYKDFVPQGASTSSAIANLILWNREPKIEFELREMGLCYSRYVDDIQVSGDRRLDRKEKRIITSKIYGMLSGAGLRPNRKKRRVQTRGRQITVHNLNVNSGNATLQRTERSRIRASVMQLEILAETSDKFDEFELEYTRVRGRVAIMLKLHPTQGNIYLERIVSAKRLFLTKTQDEI